MRGVAWSLALLSFAGSVPGVFPGEPESPRKPAPAGGEVCIAFHSHRDRNSEIYLMTRDGSVQVNLTRHPRGDSDPKWSPDGRRIAFVSNRFGSREILVHDMEAAIWRRVTSNQEEETSYVWTRDSRALVYAAYPYKGEREKGDVYLSPVDKTGEAKRLTSKSGKYQVHEVVPDGRAVLCTEERGEREDILALELERGSANVLIGEGSSNGWPTVSPDGKRVAFMSDRDGGSDIYTVPLEGGAAERLTTGEVLRLGGLHWSRDGRRIGFTSDKGGARRACVLDVETKTVLRVPESDEFCAFLGDGCVLVVAACTPGGVKGIAVVDSTGKEMRWLARTERGDYGPDYSALRDGY